MQFPEIPIPIPNKNRKNKNTGVNGFFSQIWLYYVDVYIDYGMTESWLSHKFDWKAFHRLKM